MFSFFKNVWVRAVKAFTHIFYETNEFYYGFDDDDEECEFDDDKEYEF
jgi:hypothetical protein